MHLTNNLLSVQIDQMHFLYLLFCLFIMKQADFCVNIYTKTFFTACLMYSVLAGKSC